MRIAIIHFTRRKIGGAESYLESIVSGLLTRGHHIAFWHETDELANGPLMVFPTNLVQWSVPSSGVAQALTALRDWRPDLLYAHGFVDDDFQARLLDCGIPAVFFSHNYYGTCISGQKAFAWPEHTPCARRFGAACCALYLPRRCGGLNPRTMWRDYRTQSRRLQLLRRYRKLVVASEHMAAEYARHGLAAEVVPYWAETSQAGLPFPLSEPATEHETRLVFVGRMESNKGGELLIDALPMVAGAFAKPVTCHFVGSGSQQAAWEQQAARLTRRHPEARACFHGWLAGPERDAVVGKAHLLVLPSVWPEPFGLVGLEAGASGIPAVAFDLGGISQWLEEGINGTLAPGKPPRAAGLAEAIIRALTDPEQYQRLRQGAFTATSERFTKTKHMDILERIFASSIDHVDPVAPASAS